MAEQGKSKIKEHAHHFLRRQGDCSQRVRHGRPNKSISAYYCDVLRRLRENMRRLRSELLATEETGYCITTTHRLTLHFSPGNNFLFTKNNMTVVPHPIFVCFLD
jgi:hypothetical protein